MPKLETRLGAAAAASPTTKDGGPAVANFVQEVTSCSKLGHKFRRGRLFGPWRGCWRGIGPGNSTRGAVIVDNGNGRQSLLNVSEAMLHIYALLNLLGSRWEEGSPSLSVLIGPIVPDPVASRNDTRFLHGHGSMGTGNLNCVQVRSCN